MSITDWADMLPDTITWEPFSSRDEYGARTFDTAVSYSARVIYKPRRVMSFSGAEVTSRGEVWIQGTPDVGPEDRVTLPDGDQPTILAASRIPDENGAHHVKVFFGGTTKRFTRE